MGLNKTKGNMYKDITHTWNAIKGACSHGCGYCYMKRWGKLNPVRLDEKEFKTDLGSGNTIFVGSSTDMFAADIPMEWIQRVLDHCKKFDNTYLLQTKNPARYHEFDFPENFFILGTTIETNRPYLLSKAPQPRVRAADMFLLKRKFKKTNKKFITIEPICNFDIDELVEIIDFSEAYSVNIGADSGNNKLPEPPKEKIEALIEKLEELNIKVVRKPNLNRLLKQGVTHEHK